MEDVPFSERTAGLQAINYDQAAAAALEAGRWDDAQNFAIRAGNWQLTGKCMTTAGVNRDSFFLRH